jgi:hypothetical protein
MIAKGAKLAKGSKAFFIFGVYREESPAHLSIAGEMGKCLRNLRRLRKSGYQTGLLAVPEA